MYSQDNIVYSSINSENTRTSTVTMHGIRLSQLNDVDMTQAVDGAVIVYDGENFVVNSSIPNELDTKVDKVTGKALSDQNYTLTEKNKLAGIAVGAEVNVNADWTASTGDSFISNKPTLGTAAAAAISDFAAADHTNDDARHLTSTQNTLIDGITVTSTKINYLTDVTSNIQAQFTGKAAASHNHVSANITDATADGDASRGKILKTDAAGNLRVNQLTLTNIVPATANFSIATGANTLVSFGSDTLNVSGKFQCGGGTANITGGVSLGGTSNGTNSLSAGLNTIANGNFSHAAGYESSTGILGQAAYAQGYQCEANGSVSYASGWRAKATLDGAHVMTDSQDADEISTLTNQMTCRFQNGYQFKGGDATFTGTITAAAVNVVTPIVLISSNTIFEQSSNGKIFHASGVTTLTLPAASTLADGWSIGVVNVGGSPLTVNRSNTDTINGTLSTFSNTVPYSAVYIYKSSSSSFVAIGVLY